MTSPPPRRAGAGRPYRGGARKGPAGPPRRPPTLRPPIDDPARQAALDLLVAVRSRGTWLYPPSHYVLEPEDTILLVGPTRDVERFLARD